MTADGRIIPVDVGQTIIRLQGLEFHTQVIFAEPGEPSLLGTVTLEEAVLALDPVTKRLITQNFATYLTKNTVGPTIASNDGFSLYSLDRHHSAA